MCTVLIGQILVILGCVVYLVWWYRGFRPGTSVNRVGGINGALLLVTAVLALSGIALSLKAVMEMPSQNHSTALIAAAGIISYVVLMLITRYLFQRVVTTELMLIVVWTTVELIVVSRLNAGGLLGNTGFTAMCVVIAAAFAISMVLYVAYYRMEAMKAFYAAMVPLITEALSMAVLVGILLCRG